MRATLAVCERDVVIDTKTGWLSGVQHVPSPNCDARPDNAQLDLIIIHGISLPPAEFDGNWIDLFFTNELPVAAHRYFAEIAHLRVSAHVLIRRNGSLTQYVPFTARAWHAGESDYCGRKSCNDFSVGIELEGTDEIPYEPAQYTALAKLVYSLRGAYPSLQKAELVGHCDISPGRKTDPGPSFDWTLLKRHLAAFAS
jgi:AmpD protein